MQINLITDEGVGTKFIDIFVDHGHKCYIFKSVSCYNELKVYLNKDAGILGGNKLCFIIKPKNEQKILLR